MMLHSKEEDVIRHLALVGRVQIMIILCGKSIKTSSQIREMGEKS